MTIFNHYQAYSLPKGWLVLLDEELGIVHAHEHAVLAWSGHASDAAAALRAAS